MSESVGLGESRVEKILNLLLDPQNPRLPESKQGISQAELAEELDLGFEAYTIAESIASHGFFKSEPLIVIPTESDEGKWITVEGNRRLTALLALAREDVRKNFPDPDKWNEHLRKNKEYYYNKKNNKINNNNNNNNTTMYSNSSN
jgi:hypothetical protein